MGPPCSPAFLLPRVRSRPPTGNVANVVSPYLHHLYVVLERMLRAYTIYIWYYGCK